jgi:hypothetical protein
MSKIAAQKFTDMRERLSQVEAASKPKKRGRKQDPNTPELIRQAVGFRLKGMNKYKMAPLLYPSLPHKTAYSNTRSLFSNNKAAFEAETRRQNDLSS